MSEPKPSILKYAQLISKKFTDVVDETKQIFTARREEKQLEMKIIELESEISDAEATIQDQKSSMPVNWDALCEAIDDKELAQRKLIIFQGLKKELF